MNRPPILLFLLPFGHSTFSMTIVMAQELFPGKMATASGAIAGFAIGTGGIGVTREDAP